MRVFPANDEAAWEGFLKAQSWTPFLQSWTMGEVYREVGQEPIRLEISNLKSQISNGIVGICQAMSVPAKRGKHLSVPYGPVLGHGTWDIGQGMKLLVDHLVEIAREKGCSFIRMSPFWRLDTTSRVIPSVPSMKCEGCIEGATRLVTRHDMLSVLQDLGFCPSPLHMLAEHIWYLDLRGKNEEDILRGMRQTTRNLVRRAEREGVTVEVSNDPVRDLPLFFTLYDETRKRHHFVPYPNDFIRAQVEKFSSSPSPNPNPSPSQCALYLARYQGEVIAASIHMLYGGETSYHHGASTQKYPKVPASYLLQWRAIQDALRRGDRIYNFWGVAPLQKNPSEGAGLVGPAPAGLHSGKGEPVRGKPLGFSLTLKHPFAGVTMFKTGFGGRLLELQHCMDLPLSKKYWITFGIETIRRWRRGF